MNVGPATLRDGSVVVIRSVGPADAQLLAEGFARLSRQSRQLRFLASRARLSDADLRYLTEIDHHDHEALGALDPADGRGLGIARYIRSPDDPERAELAVTVVDEWQGRGLGTELLSRLADRARHEGIRCFTALVAADNSAVVAMLAERHTGVRVTERDSGTVEYEIALPARGLGAGLRAVLRAFGRWQLHLEAPVGEARDGARVEQITGQGPEPRS